MSYLVIVIDDQHERRTPGYKRLEAAMSELPGFEVEFKYVTKPNMLQPMLQNDHFSAVIVDAVLDEDWPNFTISDALKIIGEKVPIAIISERWDETNSTQINEAWEKTNCRTFLHWRDIEPNGKGQIDYAVRAFTSLIADSKDIDASFTLEPNDPIRILHISDVQIGGIKEEDIKLEAKCCADHILQHWKSPPTFVAFTGDVAEFGSPPQYNAARDWIDYFIKRLGLAGVPARNILYVPGNHDVNLSLAASARIRLVPDPEGNDDRLTVDLCDEIQQEYLLEYAYTPFRDFLAEINDCPLLDRDSISDGYSMPWVEARFRHLGVIFYGLNTAQPPSAFGTPGRKVNSNVLAQIGDKLKECINDCGGTKPVVIGLGHHCPTSASNDSAVSNPEAFQKLFNGEPKTALFLHGHIHEHCLDYSSKNGLRMVRSCATTLTKKASSRPPDSFRGYNLLELSRTNNVVKGLEAISFGWIGSKLQDVQKGSWLLSDDGMFRESTS